MKYVLQYEYVMNCLEKTSLNSDNKRLNCVIVRVKIYENTQP